MAHTCRQASFSRVALHIFDTDLLGLKPGVPCGEPGSMLQHLEKYFCQPLQHTVLVLILIKNYLFELRSDLAKAPKESIIRCQSLMETTQPA